ncbi:hypothetical protein J3D56_000081 [Erwinia persicina]|nr:hypothetical protein [Erwinia persicina]
MVVLRLASCGKDSRHCVPCPAGQTFEVEASHPSPWGIWKIVLKHWNPKRSEMVVGEGFTSLRSVPCGSNLRGRSFSSFPVGDLEDCA